MLRSAEGAIRQRGHSYQVDTRVNGRRVRKSYPTRAAAVEALAELRDVPAFTVGEGPTLAQVADRYARDLRARHKKPASVQSAEKAFRALCLVLHPDRIISSLVEEDLREYVHVRRAEGVQVATINREVKYLKLALRALDIETPCRITPPPVHRKRPKRLTPSEVRRVIQAAALNIRPLLLVAVGTGLRNTELRQLRWESVSLADGYLMVTASKDWTPKSQAGERQVPLPKSALEELAKLPHREGFVFLTQKGTPWCSATDLGYPVRQAFHRAGIREPGKVGLHALRRTWLSTLLDRGIPLHVAQRLGGWADAQTVLHHYAVAGEEEQRRAATILEEVFSYGAASPSL